VGLLDNSVFDMWVERGADQIRKASWVDKLAIRGRNEVIPELPEELQAAGQESIDRLVASRNALALVSARAFLKITSYLGLGLEDEARLLYLREHASHVERQAALKQAMGEASDADRAARAAWIEVQGAALDVLGKLGQAAIPLLVASL
jgi:hypothetical protein